MYSFYRYAQSTFCILGPAPEAQKHTGDSYLLGVYIVSEKSQSKKAANKQNPWLQPMMNSLNKVKGALVDKDRRAYFRRCKVEKPVQADDIESKPQKGEGTAEERDSGRRMTNLQLPGLPSSFRGPGGQKAVAKEDSDEVSWEEGQSQVTQALVDLAGFRIYSKGQVKLLKASSKRMASSDLHL